MTRPVRRLLDALYDSAAVLAAAALVGLFGCVLVSIFGRRFGVNFAGVDAYAGYLMAAAGFLALAQTFKRGEHIRVTLVIERLAGRWRGALEAWALALATLLALLLATYSVRLVWQSHRFNDISTANDATPLWIPQLAMAIGTAVLAIALIDELVLELTGHRRRPVQGDESTRHE